MIHFVTIHLHKQVHVQALGLTSTLYLHCWGINSAEAVRHAEAYCLGSGLEPKPGATASVAAQQEPKRYTFPEQIYGLPKDVAENAIRSCNYGPPITAETLQTLAKKRATVQKGLALLAP